MADLTITVDSTQLVKATQHIGKFRSELGVMAQSASRTAGPVSRLTSEHGRLVRATDQASSATRRHAAAQEVSSKALQRSTRSMGRGQVAIQQTGYQLGDFIVQVQSGTNAYVAAGQQLTQMAGLLTLMGGSMVAIGATLSVIIPLVTAFGAAWSRTRQEAENAGDSIESALSSLEGSVRDVSDVQGDLNEAIRLQAIIQDESSASILNNLRLELSARQQLLAVQRAELEIQREQLRAGIEARREQIEGLFNELNSITDDSVEGAFRDQGASARIEAMQRIIEANRQLFLEQQRANAQLELTNSILERIDNGYEPIVEAARNLAEANSEAFDGLQEEAQQAQQAALEISSSLYQGFVEADSAAQEFMTTLIQNLGYSFEEAVKTNEALQEIGSLDTSNTVAAILAIADALGIATAEAIALAQNMPGYTGGGVSGPDGAQYEAGPDAGPLGNFAPDGFVRDVRTGDLASTGPSPASSGSSGGGVGGGDGFVSMFPQLAAEVQMAQEAMAAAKQEQDILNTALEEGIITQQQYKDMMAQVEAQYGELNEATQEHIVTMGDFASSMAQTMSNAFMGIIDGTKSVGDAIQEMIKKIIAEFIKLAIINPIINSIFGSIPGFSFLPSFFAKGGAFSKGRVLPFADGGVVDSTMAFPMSGGKTGIMGEAGPEAILPLKRGPDGRLGVEASGGGGGQRPIVFNMNYSFQGGITEQDLARATPKIVEQTKRSVVESVQRGGTFAKSLRGR